MIRTLKEGLNSFRYLLNFKDYNRQEKRMKVMLLILGLPLLILLFVLTVIFYGFERILSPVFKLFIYMQIKFIQARNFASAWKTRLIAVVNLLFTLAVLPFVVLYYLAMLLKMLMKSLIKSLIIKFDFTAQYNRFDLKIFDDFAQPAGFNMGAFMKDAPQTQALNKALESYFEEADDDSLSKDNH